MYAVIKTGGKQYRVQAGDLVVVEKLRGEPGAKLAFDKVLMIGQGAAVTLGEPTVEGASVSATLVETRKGEKIKVFKKIRRQGYRRTRGHRQPQSVVRVTAIAGAGQSETWDGTVDLTPLAVLNARARNLARGMEAADAKRSAAVDSKASAAIAKGGTKPAARKAVAKVKAPKAEAPKAEAPKAETAAKTKKAATPAKAKTKQAAAPTQAPAKKAPKAPAAKKETKAPATKKAAAKTAAPARKSSGKAAKPAGKKG